MAHELPSIFKKEIIKEKKKEGKKISIPQNLSREEGKKDYASNKKLDFANSKNLITVFGFSPKNVNHILKLVKEFGRLNSIEHGKNWMVIHFVEEKSCERAYRSLNKKIIDEEMIGVFREGVVMNEEGGLFFEQPLNFFQWLSKYFFGEKTIK